MGLTQLVSDITDAIKKNLKTVGKAASKNMDDMAKTGNKYVDEIAEQLGKSEGNKVLDEAVYSMDNAVQTGERAGKMKKADIKAKKAEIKARMEAKANGEEVRYSGNLGGVNEGSRSLYHVTDNNIDYAYDGKSWKKAQYTVGSNGKPSAVYYTDVDIPTSAKLKKKFLTEPPENLDKRQWTEKQIEDATKNAGLTSDELEGLKRNVMDGPTHNQRQKELESVWTPRTQDDLNKANRGWRQRTLDGVEEKVSNAWDHISGNHRRHTTEQRRAYNQRVFDSGGEFINTNREYERMQRQYAASNADTADTLYENMMNAQKISQTGAGDNSGIDLGEFLGKHPVIGLGTAAVGGGIISNMLDDDDDE